MDIQGCSKYRNISLTRALSNENSQQSGSISARSGGYRSPRWENIPRHCSSWGCPAKFDAGIPSSHPQGPWKHPLLYSMGCRINNAYECAPKRATIRAGCMWTLGRTCRCACFDRSAIKRATRFLNLGGIDEYTGRPERSLVVRTVSTIVRGLNTERVVLYTIIKNLSYDDSLKER